VEWNHPKSIKRSWYISQSGRKETRNEWRNFSKQRLLILFDLLTPCVTYNLTFWVFLSFNMCNSPRLSCLILFEFSLITWIKFNFTLNATCSSPLPLKKKKSTHRELSQPPVLWPEPYAESQKVGSDHSYVPCRRLEEPILTTCGVEIYSCFTYAARNGWNEKLPAWEEVSTS